MAVVHTAYCISNVHAPLSRLQPNAVLEAFAYKKSSPSWIAALAILARSFLPPPFPHDEASNNRCFFWPASPHFVYLTLFMGGEDELSVMMEGERLRRCAPCIR